MDIFALSNEKLCDLKKNKYNIQQIVLFSFGWANTLGSGGIYAIILHIFFSSWTKTLNLPPPPLNSTNINVDDKKWVEELFWRKEIGKLS